MVSRAFPTFTDAAAVQDWLAEHFSEAELRQVLQQALQHLQDLELEPETLQARGQLLDSLAEMRADRTTLLAAVLHPEVEAGRLTLADVGETYGEAVVKLIRALEKLHLLDQQRTYPDEAKARQHQLESLRRMLLAMVEDVRAVLIKLAERLQLMRGLRAWPEQEQHYTAQETLEIFAPLANRLGIGRLKWELEDLSLRSLQNADYLHIAKSLDSRRSEREAYLQAIMQTLRDDLAAVGINAAISGRPKHIYSIWRKMQRKGVDFQEIFDALAVRVMVDNIGQCYTALGLVHARWTPIAKEFDDYIAAPKANGYSSLHTAVIGPEGRQFEVQIRTHDMHAAAELGVASHWSYKEGVKQHDSALEQRIAALRELLEDKEAEQDASLQDEEYSGEERIYVLSPQGKVVEMPNGATPLDFAYHIHTSVGHRCRGAKVDGRITPLTYKLKSGEQVEILTAREERPSRNWLSSEYLFTSSARGKVRRWLNQQQLEQHISEGRNLLERELHRLNVSDVPLEELARRFNNKSLDTFLAEIGRGEISSGQIAHQLQEHILPKHKDLSPDDLRLHSASKDAGSSGISSQGVDGLLTHTAKCCNPLPGDAVIGYVTRERGIAVHKRSCPQAQHWLEEDNARLIDVEWGQQQKTRYPVRVALRAYDRKALLRDVSDTLSEEKINITGVQTHTDDKDNIAHMVFNLEVRDVEQLSRIMNRLENLHHVLDVRRV